MLQDFTLRTVLEPRASIPEVVGSISIVVRQNFQPAPCGYHL